MKITEITNMANMAKQTGAKDIKITNTIITLSAMIQHLADGDINITTERQVWSADEMSRFIESILLKLPLPVFYLNVSDKPWIVVDGLQRLKALDRFFVKKNLKLQNLEFLSELNGDTYNELSRVYRRTIDDTQFISYLIEPQTPAHIRHALAARIRHTHR